jgi:exodeoxyribonuclease VII small subunit
MLKSFPSWPVAGVQKMSTPVSRSDIEDDSVELPASFEQALAELEQLVADMEGGELSLEASLAAYKRGALLARFCQERLAAAEQQVRVLEGGVLKNLRPADSDDA